MPDINKVIVGGKQLLELDPHRRIRFAISDPGSITPRGDSYEESLPNWSARAVALALGIDTSNNPHPAFKAVSCVEVACALCGTVLDEEGEGGFHFNSREEAVKQANGFGWDVLSDGRVICANDEGDHEQVRHADYEAKQQAAS